MKNLFRAIFTENPVFVLMLGICSSLAITTTFENAYVMGICLTIVLLISNTIISLIKGFIDDNVKTPVYIIIIGTIVTAMQLILEKYSPALLEALGIYLALLVVNCILLGKALQVASKSSFKTTIIDSLGTGIGYSFALMIIGAIREILGTNSITIMNNVSSITGYKLVYTNIFKSSEFFPISLFTTPAGAFITLAFLLAFFNFLKGGKKV
jgi:Predicted NADH:ubiquinone oxidoreductase, subunit RnfE